MFVPQAKSGGFPGSGPLRQDETLNDGEGNVIAVIDWRRLACARRRPAGEMRRR